MVHVRVRRHEDGRTLVYGYTESFTEEHYEAGELLEAEDANTDDVLHDIIRTICLGTRKPELATAVLTTLPPTKLI